MSTGLVLSGGGARGIAHIGAIKALEEYGVQITHLAGTSAGAIVGALYASGKGWEEILDFFKSVDLFSFSNYAWDKPGFVDTDKFYDRFTNYLEQDSFESLGIPLFITATNILDGSIEIFSEGELIRPVLASASFPGLFAPVKIGKKYYIDGGVLNNFPADLLTSLCDKIYGVNVNPFEQVQIEDLQHAYDIIERAFKIRSAHDSRSKFHHCQLVISPEGLQSFNTFSLKNIDKIFSIGYKAAVKALENAKKPGG